MNHRHALAIATLVPLLACAPSPYSRARRQAEVAARETRRLADRQRREAERTAREEAILRADAEAAVARLLSDANERAARLEGSVYVEDRTWTRHIVFVPGQDPMDGGSYFDSDWGEPVPENGVLHTWRDRVARAQTLAYRYVDPVVTEIERSTEPPWFVARVELVLVQQRRSSTGGSLQQVPEPPAGHVTWIPEGRNLRAGGSSESWRRPHLPGLDALPGERYSAQGSFAPRVHDAVEALRRAATSETRDRVTAWVAYDDATGAWGLHGFRGPRPSGTHLRWSTDLEVPEHAYVFPPGRHGTPADPAGSD